MDLSCKILARQYIPAIYLLCRCIYIYIYSVCVCVCVCARVWEREKVDNMMQEYIQNQRFLPIGIFKYAIKLNLKSEKFYIWILNCSLILFPVICLISFAMVCSVTQLCLTLWVPVDYSLLSSSFCGIFQARILEWVAISSSSSFANTDVFLKDFIVLPMFSMNIMLLFILWKHPGLLCYNSTTWWPTPSYE